MKDEFKQHTAKEWTEGCGWYDGWNQKGLGHSQRRHEGRKKIRRAARHRMKQEFNYNIELY